LRDSGFIRGSAIDNRIQHHIIARDLHGGALARIICYAFSVPASALVSQVNRATSETLRQQATQEGLVPLKA
jgi:hypothetical protein